MVQIFPCFGNFQNNLFSSVLDYGNESETFKGNYNKVTLKIFKQHNYVPYTLWRKINKVYNSLKLENGTRFWYIVQTKKFIII